tara:strand:- start:79 stop:435 length:357 start_codon:yes stop_codon:yes gene_type:complete
LYTISTLLVVSKKSAPSTRASPSLSTVGLPPDVDLAPRYLSSKLSKLAAADVAELAAAVALDDASLAFVVAVVALDAAAVAELAAAVADVAALVADVVADAASTIKSYFALFAFVVRG